MNARTVNLALLVLVPLEVASGFASFLVGTPEGRWVFWLHATGGLTLAVLIPWKAGIALRSFARRERGLWAAMPVVLTVLFLAALVSGLAWSTIGLPRVTLPLYGTVTGLTLHVALAVAVLPLLLIHAALRWSPPRAVDFFSRRQAVRAIGGLAAGAVVWQATEGLSALASLPGADRRFTGSREEGSFAGNAHPVTNWFLDTTQRIDRSAWRLTIGGRVSRGRALTYEDLDSMPSTVSRALLDCTGGWFTRQEWEGVALDALLSEAGVLEGARSVVVRSVTGYSRRFALDDAGRLMLALRVGGEPLSPVHGFPARLVAPGWRGYNWVKWVESIEASEEPALLQPPLPLQ